MDSNENMEYDKELADYNESLESFLAMMDTFNKMGPLIENIISNESFDMPTVASLESIVPGILTDDYDVNSAGGIFKPEAYEVALEQAINTEFDMAMLLMGKFFKLNMRAAKLLGKSSAQLAGVISTIADDKMVNLDRGVLSTTIQGANKIPTVNYSALPSGTRNQLIKLVSSYTGNKGVGESEVVKTIAAVKSSKNGIEIMSKVFMSRYSNLLLPIFYIPNKDYKGITSFFATMDEEVLPKVDTNLNTAIMQLNTVMNSRDWVALSKFDTRIFTNKEKEYVYNLAENVRVKLKPTYSFRRVSTKTYAGLSELLKAERKGLENVVSSCRSIFQNTVLPRIVTAPKSCQPAGSFSGSKVSKAPVAWTASVMKPSPASIRDWVTTRRPWIA